jgi:hypothetical protein
MVSLSGFTGRRAASSSVNGYKNAVMLTAWTGFCQESGAWIETWPKRLARKIGAVSSLVLP